VTSIDISSCLSIKCPSNTKKIAKEQIFIAR
jgi:hypothetical protein